MKLTPQQIEFFNREGWLFLPELFSPEEVAYLAREAEGIYDANRPEVWRAWDLLDATDGTVTVTDLAAEVGWSRRHLAKTFDAEFGFTPKVAARVMRFERANSLLRSAARPSIAEVAAVCGYYDQSHLTRDFVDLAGTSPGDWLATEHGSVEPDAAIIRLDGPAPALVRSA